MALKLNERYPGRYNNPSADYPQGSFKNRTSPTAKDGSYLEKDWANDKEGFFQSLLAEAAIVPNGSVDAVGSSQYYQALLAIALKQAGHGQCRLAVAGPTSLRLSPYNGNNLIINGVPQQIPSAGITISNAGLAASTLYYVYASISGGVLVLSLSTTGHVKGSNGVEVMIGSAAFTLVGMIYTTAATQFTDTRSQRFSINWFNRRTIFGAQGFAASRSTTTAALVEISATERIEFLTWGEDISAEALANMSQNTGTGATGANVYIDAANLAGQQVNPPSGQLVSFVSKGISAPPEGYHTIRLYGFAVSGFTSTWQLSSTVMTLQMMG